MLWRMSSAGRYEGGAPTWLAVFFENAPNLASLLVHDYQMDYLDPRANPQPSPIPHLVGSSSRSGNSESGTGAA